MADRPMTSEDFVVHAPVQEAGYTAGFEPDHADAQVQHCLIVVTNIMRLLLSRASGSIICSAVV